NINRPVTRQCYPACTRPSVSSGGCLKSQLSERGGGHIGVETRTRGALVCRDLASSLDMCRAPHGRNADIASIASPFSLSLMRLSPPRTDPGSVKRCVH